MGLPSKKAQPFLSLQLFLLIPLHKSFSPLETPPDHELSKAPDMQQDELLRKMRGRVEQCRRLAGYITDEKARGELLAMAAEGEADIARILAEAGDPTEH